MMMHASLLLYRAHHQMMMHHMHMMMMMMNSTVTMHGVTINIDRRSVCSTRVVVVAVIVETMTHILGWVKPRFDRIRPDSVSYNCRYTVIAMMMASNSSYLVM